MTGVDRGEATHTIDLKFSFADGAPITGVKDVEPKMRNLDALRLPSRRRGDNASSTHLTIGNRANRRLLRCTDSSARYVSVQRDDRASFWRHKIRDWRRT
jgi:hypothetical protein